jgi:hypothetical protein
VIFPASNTSAGIALTQDMPIFVSLRPSLPLMAPFSFLIPVTLTLAFARFRLDYAPIGRNQRLNAERSIERPVFCRATRAPGSSWPSLKSSVEW